MQVDLTSSNTTHLSCNQSPINHTHVCNQGNRLTGYLISSFQTATATVTVRHTDLMLSSSLWIHHLGVHWYNLSFELAGSSGSSSLAVASSSKLVLNLPAEVHQTVCFFTQAQPAVSMSLHPNVQHNLHCMMQLFTAIAVEDVHLKQ